MKMKLILAAALALLGSSTVFADYPERPVTIIVPVGPGAGVCTENLIRID